jgi:hypothetical protein
MANLGLFVDDSGNREYSDDNVYSVSGKSRYFVLGGLLAEEREAQFFIARLRDLKRLTFGTPDVEVKCNWLRMPKERTAHYLEPFGVTNDQLTAFTNDYYRLIVQASVTLIAAVVDKVHMRERYGKSAWYPHAAAYDVLMQRAVMAVGDAGSLAVTMDNMSGKTPEQNPYTELLHKHHERLRQRGSQLQPRLSFSCLSGPVKFVNSAHSDLVQVSDLTAYNVHRQFRDFGTQWERQVEVGAQLPTYEYFDRIVGKFRRSDAGRVQGFGIAKFPLVNRVPWAVTEEETDADVRGKNVAAP